MGSKVWEDYVRGIGGEDERSWEKKKKKKKKKRRE